MAETETTKTIAFALSRLVGCPPDSEVHGESSLSGEAVYLGRASALSDALAAALAALRASNGGATDA